MNRDCCGGAELDGEMAENVCGAVYPVAYVD